MRKAFNPYSAAGFALATGFAVSRDWSLPEFCWSTWLAGLFYSWACVATASAQIILFVRRDRSIYEEFFPAFKRFSQNILVLCVAVSTVVVALIAFRLYLYIFGFYGLFLSVFSEMEPRALFGRNGFINSDFFTPLVYLVDRFWPMVAGVLISNWQDLVGKHPLKRLMLPFQGEVLRMHIMVLALPFASLAAWALFGERYQTAAILLLMALFYLLPRKRPAEDQAIKVGAGSVISSTGVN